MARSLTIFRADDGTYLTPVSDRLRGGWCFLSLRLPSGKTGATRSNRIWPRRMARDGADRDSPQAMLVQVHAETRCSDDGLPLARLLPARRGGRFSGLLYLPPEAVAIRVRLFAESDLPESVAIRCTRIRRAQAAVAIMGRHARHLAVTLVRGLLTSPRTVPGRFRCELSRLATMDGTPPPYALWVRLFDHWTERDRARQLQAPDRGAWPDITPLVFSADPAGPVVPSTRAAAMACDEIGASPVVIGPGGTTLRAAVARITTEYVAVLQAGEVVPAHALVLLCRRAALLDRPAILYADEDQVGPDGVRHTPLFKPSPSRTLMLSGTLCTGVWLIARDHLAGFSPGSDAWAETLRLDAWLRLQEAGRALSSHRVPSVLTHRRPDTEAAPPAALASVAAEHIARAGLPARIAVGRPLRIGLAARRSAQQRVSIIVPSACRARHVLRYVSAVLARTDYADFELIVAVAAKLPLTAGQERVLARLESDRRVRRVLIDTGRFNYAEANNRAVAATDSALVCLVNDDVAPCGPGWLAAMVGHLADPGIGVVGARLCYPDHTIQHAGVLLRPGGTGEHMHCSLPCGAPGYAWRAQLSQEVSAVTGACLLTRRDLWDRLGGLDESYATALNDVDFCLRARAAGFGVVIAAEAELIHAERSSFGAHYGRDSAEQQRNLSDRLRLLDRFSGVFQADPFHNRNLEVRWGDCWSPAFPPRRERVPAAGWSSTADHTPAGRAVAMRKEDSGIVPGACLPSDPGRDTTHTGPHDK